MTTLEHLRGIRSLHPLRGQHPVVVVCLDDPAPYADLGPRLGELDARLILEREAGPLSAKLGRPSVTVCDRFLDVALQRAHVPPDEILKTVRWLEMRCEECPQSGVDMAPRRIAGDWG